MASRATRVSAAEVAAMHQVRFDKYDTRPELARSTPLPPEQLERNLQHLKKTRCCGCFSWRTHAETPKVEIEITEVNEIPPKSIPRFEDLVDVDGVSKYKQSASKSEEVFKKTEKDS